MSTVGSARFRSGSLVFPSRLQEGLFEGAARPAPAQILAKVEIDHEEAGGKTVTSGQGQSLGAQRVKPIVYQPTAQNGLPGGVLPHGRNTSGQNRGVGRTSVRGVETRASALSHNTP